MEGPICVSTPAPRLAPLPEAEIPDKTLEALAPYRGSDGEIYTIWSTLARHPDALRRFIVFGNHVLGKNTLPVRSRELIILRIAYRAQAEYEWGQHVRIALRAGVLSDEVADVAAGRYTSFSAGDIALLEVTDELLTDQHVSDAGWARLRGSWSEQQIIDAVYTVGQYLTIAMLINTFQIVPEAGADQLPRPDVTPNAEDAQ